jgi:hypothetical protein
MDHLVFIGMLDQLRMYIDDQVKVYGPEGKGIRYCDPVKDPEQPRDKVDYFFLMGDVVKQNGRTAISVPPTGNGTRTVWTSIRMIKDTDLPLVLNYYVFDKDPDVPSLMKVSYGDNLGSIAQAAIDVYNFIAKGDVPRFKDETTH